MQSKHGRLESSDGRDNRIVVLVATERGGKRGSGLGAGQIADLILDRQRISPGEAAELARARVASRIFPFGLGGQPITGGHGALQHVGGVFLLIGRGQAIPG